MDRMPSKLTVEAVALAVSMLVAFRARIPGAEWLRRLEISAASFARRKALVCISLALLVLIGTMPLLGACHTTAGAGEDLSATGHAITHSADKNTP